MFKFFSISMNVSIYHLVFYNSPSCWCLKYCVQVDEWKCHNFPRDELYNLLTVFMEFGFAKNSELTTSLGKCYIKTWCYKDLSWMVWVKPRIYKEGWTERAIILCKLNKSLLESSLSAGIHRQKSLFTCRFLDLLIVFD